MHPKISILLAVRNEANNILTCLESLEKLSFAKENLEILIGNDASTDDTATLIDNFIANKPYFRQYLITSNLNNLFGKANVLAQLAKNAKGDWLFFTDADIQVPADWIQEMLQNHRQASVDIGMVMGFTSVIPSNFFAILQALDWTFYIGVLDIFATLGKPMTAMGNNMAIANKAYQAVGGYENINFSVTEDYAIFRAIRTQNIGFQQLASDKVLAFTQALPTLQDVLRQRIRWLGEFKTFPIWIQGSIIVTGFHLPIFCLLLVLSPYLFSLFYGLRLLSIYSILLYYIYKTKQYCLVKYCIFYDIFHLFFSLLLVIQFFGKKNILWKGRTYAKK
jgi:glycosyltransferase involved in cell wall biosynthesis